MPHTTRLHELTALLMLALALTAPLSAYAQESSITPAANLAVADGSTSGFSTTEQTDESVVDELMLAFASTLVGIAAVVVVFALNRKEQER
ncbi:MAG: hypothetical protein CVT66_09950 [Actinobacteria bacterium HGW-Actinobacteria-6]|nr:MAG: hypothetical protein CVT66_09950 [Actinobacteria bacterium HGW-Actinobacteria-6]